MIRSNDKINIIDVCHSVAGQMQILECGAVVVIVMSSAYEYIVGRSMRWYLNTTCNISTTPELYRMNPYVHVTFTNSIIDLIVMRYNFLLNGVTFASLGCAPDQYPIWYMYGIPDSISNMTCQEFDYSDDGKKFISEYDNERKFLGI